MQTKVIESEYKGNKLFAVWEVDDEGNKKGNYPLASMGKKKLKAIVKHLEEAKEFLGDE